MSGNKKITAYMLIILIGSILIIAPVLSDQIFGITLKSDSLSKGREDRFMQEKQKYQYVGSEKCSTCHNNKEMGFQYDLWKKSLHARSFLSLSSKKALHYAKTAGVKEDPKEVAACLKCHVTGGELDTSFLAVTYKKEDGVGCEACHKREYVAKTYLPVETDCLKCHNNSVHKMPRFDFNDGCAKIAHPRPKADLKGM